MKICDKKNISSKQNDMPVKKQETQKPPHNRFFANKSKSQPVSQSVKADFPDFLIFIYQTQFSKISGLNICIHKIPKFM